MTPLWPKPPATIRALRCQMTNDPYATAVQGGEGYSTLFWPGTGHEKPYTSPQKADF